MKPALRFWLCVILIIGGVGISSYYSGRYEGIRESDRHAQRFIYDFVRATDVENYLQLRGQADWQKRLMTLGRSHYQVSQEWTISMLIGLLLTTVGLVGLTFTWNSATKRSTKTEITK